MAGLAVILVWCLLLLGRCWPPRVGCSWAASCFACFGLCRPVLDPRGTRLDGGCRSRVGRRRFMFHCRDLSRCIIQCRRRPAAPGGDAGPASLSFYMQRNSSSVPRCHQCLRARNSVDLRVIVESFSCQACVLAFLFRAAISACEKAIEWTHALACHVSNIRRPAAGPATGLAGPT